jgi:hypothetical protein
MQRRELPVPSPDPPHSEPSNQSENTSCGNRAAASMASIRNSAQKASRTIGLASAAAATVVLEKAAVAAARLTNRCDTINEHIVNWIKQQHP